MSVWGKAWGSAFGNAWGDVAPVIPPNTSLDLILAILMGRKVYDQVTKLWHVYDANGVELVDPSGILMQGLHGLLLRGANEVQSAQSYPGGIAGKQPKLKKPYWYNPLPLIEPEEYQHEEDEALMLCCIL